MFYRRIIPFRIVSRNSPHSLLDAIALRCSFYFIDTHTHNNFGSSKGNFHARVHSAPRGCHNYELVQL